MNPDTIGCEWTGEFDLNTLRVNGEIFESGKKKLGPDSKISGYVRTGPDRTVSMFLDKLTLLITFCY